ncbi:Cro/CI family transcriptional regulator [Kushneria sp. Sum13]|uniref:Cro/CI family transcriptional regulator n=1 Tax=Kushneria sp. Sum13 TaxID=3459196 RepID=UPI0040459AC0
MTKQDVIKFFGGVTATAVALGRTKGAVSQWPDQLSENLQYEIEGRTNRALRAGDSNSTAKPAAKKRA